MKGLRDAQGKGQSRNPFGDAPTENAWKAKQGTLFRVAEAQLKKDLEKTGEHVGVGICKFDLRGKCKNEHRCKWYHVPLEKFGVDPARLCLNCLAYGHAYKQCKVKGICYVCGQISYKSDRCAKAFDFCEFCGKQGHNLERCQVRTLMEAVKEGVQNHLQAEIEKAWGYKRPERGESDDDDSVPEAPKRNQKYTRNDCKFTFNQPTHFYFLQQRVSKLTSQ